MLWAKLVQAIHQFSHEPIVFFGEEDVLYFVLLVVPNYLLHYWLVVFLTRNGLLAGQHPLITQFLLPLVNQHIGIFNLLLRVVACGLTPIGLLSNIIKVEIPDHCIIELEPLAVVPVLDKGVVVATISVSQVHDHSFQHVTEVFRGKFLLLFHLKGLITLLSSQVLPGVLLEIEIGGELAVIVDFQLHHVDIVELKPLQSHNKVVRQFLQTHPLDCRYFLAAPLAEIGVIAIKGIAFDHGVETLINIFLVLDCQGYRVERLFGL